MTPEEEIIIRGIQRRGLITATCWAAGVVLAIALMNHRVWLSNLLFGADEDVAFAMTGIFGLISMIVMLIGTILVLIESVNVLWSQYLLAEEESA